MRQYVRGNANRDSIEKSAKKFYTTKTRKTCGRKGKK